MKGQLQFYSAMFKLHTFELVRIMWILLAIGRIFLVIQYCHLQLPRCHRWTIELNYWALCNQTNQNESYLCFLKNQQVLSSFIRSQMTSRNCFKIHQFHLTSLIQNYLAPDCWFLLQYMWTKIIFYIFWPNPPPVSFLI